MLLNVIWRCSRSSVCPSQAGLSPVLTRLRLARSRQPRRPRPPVPRTTTRLLGRPNRIRRCCTTDLFFVCRLRQPMPMSATVTPRRGLATNPVALTNFPAPHSEAQNRFKTARALRSGHALFISQELAAAHSPNISRDRWRHKVGAIIFAAGNPPARGALRCRARSTQRAKSGKAGARVAAALV